MLVDGNNMNVGSPGACGTVERVYVGLRTGWRAFGVPDADFPYSTIENSLTTGRRITIPLQIKAETKSDRHGIYALMGYTYSRAYETA